MTLQNQPEPLVFIYKSENALLRFHPSIYNAFDIKQLVLRAFSWCARIVFARFTVIG